jgi:hypothetical protein
MLLTFSHPHDGFSIKVLDVRIEVWPTDLLCHRSVGMDALMDGGVAVGLRRVLRVPVDVGCRLPLVCQSPCLQLGARLATVCRRLRNNSKMIRSYKLCTYGRYNKSMNSRTYPSPCVFLEGKVPSMVCCTWHLHPSLAASVMDLLPILGAPLVHHQSPARAYVGAPPRRLLHVIKYMAYKKTKLTPPKLRRNQY